MQSIYYGTAETAASILPRASWAYDNDAHISGYDPAKARAMLTQADIEQLNLKLLVPIASQPYNPQPTENGGADPGRSGSDRRQHHHSAG